MPQLHAIRLPKGGDLLAHNLLTPPAATAPTGQEQLKPSAEPRHLFDIAQAPREALLSTSVVESLLHVLFF